MSLTIEICPWETVMVFSCVCPQYTFNPTSTENSPEKLSKIACMGYPLLLASTYTVKTPSLPLQFSNFSDQTCSLKVESSILSESKEDVFTVHRSTLNQADKEFNAFFIQPAFQKSVFFFDEHSSHLAWTQQNQMSERPWMSKDTGSISGPNGFVLDFSDSLHVMKHDTSSVNASLWCTSTSCGLLPSVPVDQQCVPTLVASSYFFMDCTEKSKEEKKQKEDEGLKCWIQQIVQMWTGHIKHLSSEDAPQVAVIFPTSFPPCSFFPTVEAFRSLSYSTYIHPKRVCTYNSPVLSIPSLLPSFFVYGFHSKRFQVEIQSLPFSNVYIKDKDKDEYVQIHYSGPLLSIPKTNVILFGRAINQHINENCMKEKNTAAIKSLYLDQVCLFSHFNRFENAIYFTSAVPLSQKVDNTERVMVFL